MSCKQLLCRFYLQGTCNYGEACVYSHNENEAVPIPDDVCLFFIRSNCIYGDECRMKHRTIDQIVRNENDIETESGDDANYLLNISPSLYDEEEIVPIKFIPDVRPKSYASAASSGTSIILDHRASIPLCSYFESNGFCVYPNCPRIHGNFCDLCGRYSLHPYNQQQSNNHRTECVKEHEEIMEISFAYQRSKDLTCAICLDIVLDKEPKANRRFGILENCTHIYCIKCIRTWRKSEQDNDKKNKRNCPQCRVKSDYIIPSEYFYDDKDQKSKLIQNYKKALGTKHCKYFQKGQGTCPFEGACFYKHEYPDGRKAELPMPSKAKRNRHSRINIRSFLLFEDSMFDYFDDDEEDFSPFSDLDSDNEPIESYF